LRKNEDIRHRVKGNLTRSVNTKERGEDNFWQRKGQEKRITSERELQKESGFENVGALG